MGNVLIIDDDPAIGEYMAKLVSYLGHQSVTALSATDALARLDGGGFDLTVADICLPDAPEPAEWIRTLAGKTGGKPVVLISGAPSQELIDCANENGILAFLSKPFELAFIKSIFKSVFGT